MSTRTDNRQHRQAQPSGLRLGERLRQLRVAANLTQTDLAGERFSKEYVSQIERGKTRPTRETVEWLAGRLGVDPGFLANGVATDERGRLEGALARAETLIEALRNDEAATEYEMLVPAARATGVPELAVRALVGAGRTQMRMGSLRTALDLLNEARGIVEAGSFSDLERAEVLYALGVCRYQLNSVQTALALLASPARLRGRARGHRARAAARRGRRRPAHDRRGVLPGFARCRPRRPLGARTQLCRARPHRVRGALGQGSRRPAHEQPRRPQLPARQARGGDRAPQGGVQHRPRHRPRRGCGAGGLLDGADSPSHRQRRSGRGAGTARAPPPRGRRKRGLHRRGRKRAARARSRAARAEPHRRGRSGLRGGGVLLRAAW